MIVSAFTMKADNSFCVLHMAIKCMCLTQMKSDKKFSEFYWQMHLTA